MLQIENHDEVVDLPPVLLADLVDTFLYAAAMSAIITHDDPLLSVPLLLSPPFIYDSPDFRCTGETVGVARLRATVLKYVEIRPCH
ncbi:hypothetical protein OUY22_00395 [Nonomuraea sp. MCN248]|uniref:Uncharacterized protein n=1 Tax=Nonomuraea corallina TaxID=2989783 RepID=A0ABT4S3T9_9ACTN|nr:hypothetical protein [Nonomuraea corallina]MDA0631862.1 hypothetical protein [Nonomuraea corallina]